jgi:ABC-type dipeptide/oligopeptide/nickel transport system permease component
MIAGIAVMGQSIAMMRVALRELYGTGAPLREQYFSYWQRILSAGFGPSLSSFQTPVSVLIGRALPWTVQTPGLSRKTRVGATMRRCRLHTKTSYTDAAMF